MELETLVCLLRLFARLGVEKETMILGVLAGMDLISHLIPHPL